MNEFPKMLYKAGGPGVEAIHGAQLGTLIASNEDEQAQALADGWFLTTPEAIDADKESRAMPTPEDEAMPTRAELEAKATELGIKWDGRWRDKKLADLIAATLED